jgi:hypothetical protein
MLSRTISCSFSVTNHSTLVGLCAKWFLFLTNSDVMYDISWHGEELFGRTRSRYMMDEDLVCVICPHPVQIHTRRGPNVDVCWRPVQIHIYWWGPIVGFCPHPVRIHIGWVTIVGCLSAHSPDTYWWETIVGFSPQTVRTHTGWGTNLGCLSAPSPDTYWMRNYCGLFIRT